jgi:hypothetical protein
MATFGDWSYYADPEATARAYRSAEHAGAETCGCAGCRNFLLARNNVYPAPFLTLLEQLGVDARKDGEVYHNARLSPGRHDYGGWFHFVGELHKTGDFPPISFGDYFSVWMCKPSAPRLPPFQNLKVVQLEFHAEAVPWLLPEPELS